jgi:hypothetical protein
MRFDGEDEKICVVGPLIIDLVVGHDLVFRFLQLHQIAKFVGLAGLTLADNFRRRLEQRLRSLPSLRISPRKIRALACFMT